MARRLAITLAVLLILTPVLAVLDFSPRNGSIEEPAVGGIALAPDAAAELFAFAEVGMTIEVHW